MDPKKLLETVKEPIARTVGFRGVCATIYDATIGGQVALIAKDDATLRMLWERVVSGHEINPNKIQRVLIVADTKNQPSDA